MTLLEAMLNDNTDFVRQGASIAMALVLLQQPESVVEPFRKKVGVAAAAAAAGLWALGWGLRGHDAGTESQQRRTDAWLAGSVRFGGLQRQLKEFDFGLLRKQAEPCLSRAWATQVYWHQPCLVATRPDLSGSCHQ